MATINLLAPFILSFEGGFVNDKNDRGGATNKGVTINTWKKYGRDIDGDGDIDVDDLKMISEDDAKSIMKKNYWDKIQADKIESQSVANILVDWFWGSGYDAIKIVQRMLGVEADGLVGSKTINAINQQDPETFFDKIHKRRAQFFNDIVEKRPQNGKFLKGWMRRLNAIQYGTLICNGGKQINFDERNSPIAKEDAAQTQQATEGQDKKIRQSINKAFGV